ncbi:hypothetical protein CWS_00165 [Buchnera aphidicola str. JF99 (Acyrthosiphon pisum)]|nr:hypothetical protein CWO_00160 [Buchnera aphidicola str. LL01 (Acyrthosiphon pisum)]ADP66436.1 hypothetical protein CWQ_00180 [Buchnera aphidicola str. TLW03 (Acyrthosiphon pisum)]ADP67013.1 hypothetical protein CWS_00165 [Buchnera aphidicola str. JF99 (Acyrthosiphon pisum)]ADP67600.1 hypothetical protein CWU_00180 [Buchnera aphidicola str. JF98 (Acyrthosiphon pisum)]OQX99116.1 MAG: hypothetical protein B6I27_01410 [Erwiniaceae bacterium 4572_131]
MISILFKLNSDIFLLKLSDMFYEFEAFLYKIYIRFFIFKINYLLYIFQIYHFKFTPLLNLRNTMNFFKIVRILKNIITVFK